ncbi:hypothetical protein D3C73_827500 [compost metagenome]
MTTFELSTGAIYITVKVLSFGGPVVEHVRLGRAGAIVVVNTPLGVVGGSVPAIAGRTTVMFPLEERFDHLLLSLLGYLNDCLLDGRVLGGGIHQLPELGVE